MPSRKKEEEMKDVEEISAIGNSRDGVDHSITPKNLTMGDTSGPSLFAKLTRRKLSHAESSNLPADGTAREKFTAAIRPAADCPAMGRLNRRYPSIFRSMVTGITSHNFMGGASKRKAEEDDDMQQITLSQHGRMNVRTQVTTISVRDKISIPCEDDNDDDDQEDDGGYIHAGLSGGKSLQKNSFHDSSFHFETTTQYRLSASRPSNTLTGRLLKLIGISTSVSGIYDDAGGSDDDGCVCCWGIAPNALVAKYLHWTFRQSFLAVLFSAAVGFFGMTLFFALLLFWTGQYQPECIHVNGESFGNYTGASSFREFGDAYSLSWTSFSTVGYGLVHPSTSAQSKKAGTCGITQIICTLEAFVGILFASFCGAIMFGKVARIRSHAQVVFSDAIVVRYGTGVLVELGDDDDLSNKSGKGSLDEEEVALLDLPCPVLEFRVANRLYGVDGGEIMDCSMNIVASIDEDQADHALRKNASAKRRRKGKQVGRSRNSSGIGLLKVNEDGDFNCRPANDSLSSLAHSLRQHKVTQQQSYEEDPSGKILPKRIFVKLEIETPDHPFFKRVWTAKHTLDLESPILAEEAKQMIRINRGFWPNELNDPEMVRACINLDQILVSLSGTSNADANSVYAQKIYDFRDINVGYSFVNMLYRNNDHSLKVDLSVINNVVEQSGGGGEPLNIVREHPFGDILMVL